MKPPWLKETASQASSYCLTRETPRRKGRKFEDLGVAAYKVAETDIATVTRDVVTDFSHDHDKIDLATIDARTTAAGDQAFKFIAQQAFHHKAGELHVVRTAGHSVVEGDGNGDGHADFQIDVKVSDCGRSLERMSLARIKYGPGHWVASMLVPVRQR